MPTVTVCEVLGDPAKYTHKAVAIVGRLERAASLVDHYDYVAQDQCERPVITHGHVWSNRIQIWTDWERGMPKPPKDKPKSDQSSISAKLSAVQQTTTLGSHSEPRFKNNGNSIAYAGRAEVPNSWAAVYGRIVALKENCGSERCGGDDVRYMIIAEPYNVLTLGENGMSTSEAK